MTSVLVFVMSSSVAAGDITAGRARSLAGLAVALISVVIGGMAVARSIGAKRRSWGIVALIAGLLGVLLSALHLVSATGAIGTGSGKLGAIVALVVGLIGAGLGRLAIVRARRTS
jgi:hypothetical protein